MFPFSTDSYTYVTTLNITATSHLHVQGAKKLVIVGSEEQTSARKKKKKKEKKPSNILFPFVILSVIPVDPAKVC